MMSAANPAIAATREQGLQAPLRAQFRQRAADAWFDLRRMLGWSGLAGIACLLAAFAFWCLWVRGSDEAMASLRHDLRALREQARLAPPVVRAPTSDEQLRAFMAHFPPREQIGAALDDFSRLAVQNQLTLPSGDYKFTESKNLRLARYEIHFPVRGSYAQVYSLIAAALNAMPNLALDEIAIKRESRLAGEIEAQLRFSLYLRQD
jgi:hypothetical protein